MNHFQVVAQPYSRQCATCGGQAASVLALIWFCKDLGQHHFAKFATTTSQRCPKLENDVWATHLRLQLTQRQQYSRQYGHLFVSLAQEHFVFCLDSNFSTRRSIVDLIGRLWGHWLRISVVNFNNFDLLLACISFHHEMANLTEEKCQKRRLLSLSFHVLKTPVYRFDLYGRY